MQRREFITLLGGAVAAWPGTARTQQPPIPVIGYLSARLPESDVPYLAAFRQGLKETGYVEGKNVAIEFRWGGGQYDRLPQLAEDLIRRHVAVIVTSGGPLPALAAKAATTTIPILFVGGGDAVEGGLVASLSHPGGNVTGVISLLDELVTKQLGLLRDMVPNAAVIAFLVNPNDTTTESLIRSVQTAARAVALQSIVITAATERDIDAAFTSLVKQRASALLVGVGPFFITQTSKLVRLAAQHKVPTIYFRREFALAGGLMSYGSSAAETYRQLGIYAGRILRGEKPADLPVVRSAKFEFVINLKTPKTLGLTIPPGLMAIADEVIE